MNSLIRNGCTIHIHKHVPNISTEIYIRCRSIYSGHSLWLSKQAVPQEFLCSLTPPSLSFELFEHLVPPKAQQLQKPFDRSQAICYIHFY